MAVENDAHCNRKAHCLARNIAVSFGHLRLGNLQFPPNMDRIISNETQ